MSSKLNTSLYKAKEAAPTPTGTLSASSIMPDTAGAAGTKKAMDVSGLQSRMLQIPRPRKATQQVRLDEPTLARAPTSPMQKMLGESLGANIDGYLRIK